MLTSLLWLACADEGPPGLPGADDPEEQASGWADLPPLLEPLQEHAVVALRGEVVVLGGYDDDRRMVDRVEAFDPSTAQWRALAPLPEPSHHVNAVVHEGRIFVLGVLQASFLEEAVTWIYDPEADAWSSATAPPFDRAVGASVVAAAGGELHVVGGLQASRAVALHSVYDVAADRWRAEPDGPRARDHAAGAAVGGEVLAVGGRRSLIGAVLPDVDRYDPATGDWTAGAPLPTPRGGVAHAVGADGRLHVVGGEGNPDHPTGVFADHEVYDPATDAWEVLPPMPRPRHGMGAVFVDGVLYVPGGAPEAGFGAVDTFTRYTP